MKTKQDGIKACVNMGVDLFNLLGCTAPQGVDHSNICYGAAATLVYLLVSNNKKYEMEESTQNLMVLNKQVAEMIAAQKNHTPTPPQLLN